jgi:hypothetical protein
MADERRYTEEEVDAILKEAAEVQTSDRSLLPATHGMTMSQLQEIAREAGISPDAVKLAARRLGSVPATSTTMFFGLPLGVGRTIELDRELTNHEWEQLVADLRVTFNARGVTRQEGSLRSWSNGNLQALLEPTATGQRLRLKTLHGGARMALQMGLITIGGSIVVAAVSAVKGTVGDPATLSSLVTMMLTGSAMLGFGTIPLPGWARRRRKQMDEIADRAAQVSSTSLPEV